MIALYAQALEWRPAAGAFCLSVPAFSLKTGDRLSIVGPSGAGKSTFLGLLSFALRPSHATSFKLHAPEHPPCNLAELWQKGDLASLTALRSQFVGFVPQTSALLPFLTAKENILLPLQITGKAFCAEHFHFLSTELELQHCLEQHPSTLSVGQRQRVAVARALITNPPLILADEPTASVPPEQAAIIYKMLLTMPNSAVVMATHDRENARNSGFTLVEAKTNGPTTLIEHA